MSETPIDVVRTSPEPALPVDESRKVIYLYDSVYGAGDGPALPLEAIKKQTAIGRLADKSPERLIDLSDVKHGIRSAYFMNPIDEPDVWHSDFRVTNAKFQGPLPDMFTLGSMLVVSEKAKQVFEAAMPEAVRFFPVRILTNTGEDFTTGYQYAVVLFQITPMNYYEGPELETNSVFGGADLFKSFVRYPEVADWALQYPFWGSNALGGGDNALVFNPAFLKALHRASVSGADLYSKRGGTYEPWENISWTYLD